MSASESTQFQRYAEAVNADRYRVTCIRLREDGSKKTFILDKQDGKTIGYTPHEVEQHMPEMLRLQRRGENIYYTPLSDKRHHVLIDDMDLEKLTRLIHDGYQPAALIESSPGNFQSIITIPKLGTPHDKNVGNRITERLNSQYGDPKLSGCIHPHRAPGFENRKPKHRREDGTFPVVRLVKWAYRECAKALDLSCQIDEEYRQREAAKPARQPPTGGRRRGCVSPPRGGGGQGLSAAYYAHLDDIRRLLGSITDLSRLDSMIAIRLRVTGHDRNEIEVIIHQCAPSTRLAHEGRDWGDYARRTADYAYSPDGDREIEKWAKYLHRWSRL